MLVSNLAMWTGLSLLVVPYETCRYSDPMTKLVEDLQLEAKIAEAVGHEVVYDVRSVMLFVRPWASSQCIHTDFE